MRAEDIHDEQSLKAWLEARPEETRQREAVWIAFRAGARVFPVYGEQAKFFSEVHPYLKVDLSGLSILRCLLTSAAALVQSIPAIRLKDAARSAAFEVARSADAYDAAARKAFSISSFADANGAARAASAYAAVASLAASAAHSAAVGSTDAKGYAGQSASANPSVFVAGPASSDVDAAIRADAMAVMRSTVLTDLPLWVEVPPWFVIAEGAVFDIWAEDPVAVWDFWRRWWAGVVNGEPLPFGLQREVALIDDAIWKQGAKAVAEEIARIEAEFAGPAKDIEDAIRRTSPGSTETLQGFSTSAWKHREELPATLDAIVGYCQLEIDRLQGKNYQNNEERDEALRQIAVLGTLYSAIERLAPMIRTEAPLTEAQAVVPEKLTRIAAKAFQEWPRKNMDDLVDSTIRGALCGATATGLIMLATPPTVAWSVGALLFGGKKITDAFKAGSDSKGL